MKSIPRVLLIHTVKLLSAVQTDKWQNETAAEETEIKNVRVEPSSKRIMSKQNIQLTLSAKLFYDCKSSLPSVKFNINDKIVFKGNHYNIASIDEFYDGKRLHHLEMGLVL